MSESPGTPTVVGVGMYDSLAKIAEALERIADALDDVTDGGCVHIDGVVVAKVGAP